MPSTVSESSTAASGGRPRVDEGFDHDSLRGEGQRQLALELRRALARVLGIDPKGMLPEDLPAMKYTFVADTSVQLIVFLHCVELVGWPDRIGFRSPGAIGKKRDVDRLRARLRSGQLRFRRVPRAELEEIGRKHGLLSLLSGPSAGIVGRRDAGTKRPPRPPATRSKTHTRCTGIHTARYVGGPYY